MIKRLLATLLMAVAPLAGAAVDVNKASPEELQTIKGIGPNIAGRIVQERNRGPFKDWEDFITRTRGVGEQSASQFSAGGLTVQGRAYTPASPSTPAKTAAPSSPAVTPAPAAAGVKK